MEKYSYLIFNSHQAVRKVQQIAMTKPFREMGPTLNRLDYEGLCDKEKFDSDAYWECLIRHYAVTAYHPTCTCRIGSTNDQTSVVDTKLRYCLLTDISTFTRLLLN